MSDDDVPDYVFDRPSGRLMDSAEGRAFLRENGLPIRKDNRKGRRGYKTSKKKNKFQRAEFICWDGEGMTVANNVHNYVLFANSNHSSIQTRSADESLSTTRCFNFLLREKAKHPHAIHVIFSGTYDFNMILRNLPRSELWRLQEYGRCQYRHFYVRMLLGKWLWVRDEKTGQSVKLWDVFPFFQTSFVKTLAKWGIETDDTGLIAEQKARRNVFDWSEMPLIKRYCFAELASLKLLMGEFQLALKEAGIMLQRWDGPGAIAANLFQRHSIKAHKKVPPEHVNIAAQYAYAGGRVELIQFGNREEETFYYDINSAYPHKISSLPSLAGVQWHESSSVSDFSLVDLSWDFPPLRFYPFFFRTPRGLIHFTRSGRNWVWGIEYNSLPIELQERCTIQSVWAPRFDDATPSPFGWVSDMYEQRRQWKAEGRGAEKVLKLGLNSLYGKMIQQVGWSENRGIPPYHQLEWGGYVTAATRAQIFAAAWSDPDSVIGFETDGLITTRPIDVDCGEGLGQWGFDRFQGITYVHSGVYWTREGDGVWAPKYRGFDSGSLDRNACLDAWDSKGRTVEASLTRFQGLAYSLSYPNRFANWCKWITQRRELDVWDPGTKRIASCSNGGGDCRGCLAGESPAHMLHDTKAIAEVASLHSTPYPLVWRDGVPDWRQDWLDELAEDMSSPLAEVL